MPDVDRPEPNPVQCHHELVIAKTVIDESVDQDERPITESTAHGGDVDDRVELLRSYLVEQSSG